MCCCAINTWPYIYITQNTQSFGGGAVELWSSCVFYRPASSSSHISRAPDCLHGDCSGDLIRTRRCEDATGEQSMWFKTCILFLFGLLNNVMPINNTARYCNAICSHCSTQVKKWFMLSQWAETCLLLVFIAVSFGFILLDNVERRPHWHYLTSYSGQIKCNELYFCVSCNKYFCFKWRSWLFLLKKILLIPRTRRKAETLLNSVCCVT